MEIENWMKYHKVKNISEIIGAAHKWIIQK
jgi:dihydroorotate dehydrogenase